MAALGLLFVLSAQVQPPALGADSAGDRRTPVLVVVEQPARSMLGAFLQRSGNDLTPSPHPLAASPGADSARTGAVVLLCLGFAAAAAIRSHGVVGSLWRRAERAPPVRKPV